MGFLSDLAYAKSIPYERETTVIDIDPQTGAPIVAKDTSSSSGGQQADLTPASGFEQPKGQTGLEKDGISEAMDETMARVDTDVKAVDSLNTFNPEPEQNQASSNIPPQLMSSIQSCLKNGMDSQQQINAYEQIEEVLRGYTIKPKV